ncbi:hypothetical protein HDU97_008003 [Phlyctochytrium planicorne]|nr:hypothetical protein HDU97_008003 [Phlyctochytrium planicorne]
MDHDDLSNPWGSSQFISSSSHHTTEPTPSSDPPPPSSNYDMQAVSNALIDISPIDSTPPDASSYEMPRPPPRPPRPSTAPSPALPPRPSTGPSRPSVSSATSSAPPPYTLPTTSTPRIYGSLQTYIHNTSNPSIAPIQSSNSLVRFLAVEGPAIVQGTGGTVGNVTKMVKSGVDRLVGVVDKFIGQASGSSGSSGVGSSSGATSGPAYLSAQLGKPTSQQTPPPQQQHHQTSSPSTPTRPTTRAPLIFYLNHTQISLLIEPHDEDDATSSPSGLLVVPHTRLPHKHASPLWLNPTKSNPAIDDEEERQKPGWWMDRTIRSLAETSSEPFAVFPLVDHSHGVGSATGEGGRRRRRERRVILNARRILAVHAFRPSDASQWTTIVVRGDVSLPQSSLTAMEEAAAVSASSGGGGSGPERSGSIGMGVGSGGSSVGGGANEKEEGRGVYSFEVALPLIEVLRALDSLGYPL